MKLSQAQNAGLLDRLAEAEGFDSVDEKFEAAVSDSVCPSICVNEGCGYTCEMEPDQRAGYCENCGTKTVQSALALGDLI